MSFSEIKSELAFHPKVSIIIPVYNGSDFLKAAVESALTQTYDNFEVIIVNDGSDDDGKTEDVALSFHNKIRYFKKENGGVATALNLGIKEMKGEYFSWLSHDDVYYPEKINLQIDYLEKQKNKNIVLYSDYTYIDENSQIIRNIALPEYDSGMFRPFFIQGGYINGCTLLIPKICFENCGLFSQELKITQDYDLWFRIARKFEFHHTAKCLVYSRLHENQGTLKLSSIRLKEANLLYVKFLKKVTRKEIGRFSKKNHSGYYANFSLRMSEFGFIKARDYATKLAVFNLPFSGYKNLNTDIDLLLSILRSRNIRRFFKVIKFFAMKFPNQNVN
jgi:glycosyltransferase involved in cell wall biosynthesis